MSRSSKLILILLLSACFLSVAPAARATIIHSNVNAATVVYTNISEGSPTGDPEPLYGQPFAVVNNLVFAPTADFAATSNDGGPSDQTDGKLTFIATAKVGNALSVIELSENGFTTLNAPFGGDAFTSVQGFAQIKVLGISGNPVSAAPTNHLFTFTPSNSFQHSVDATGSTFATTWQGSLSVLLPPKVSKVLVTIDNHLFAATVGPGTSALIDKKGFEVDFDIELNPDYVPEPASWVLGIVGMSLFALRRR